MTGVRLSIEEIRFAERSVELRLPFKFGVVTLTHAPQVFVRARVRLEDGRQAWGESAELMVPKWFDKSPRLSNEQNIDQLRQSLQFAAQAYQAISRPRSAFDIFADNYAPLLATGAERGQPSLVSCFGAAELDKAIVDGLCQALGISFQQAITGNVVGMDFSRLAADLDGFDGSGFLAGLQPRKQVNVRHTVGMADPLVEADQNPLERVDDGLPETLEQVIDSYRHSYFKIKLCGDLEADLRRLCAIAAVLDGRLADYRITLDGNEQYDDAQGVLALWDGMAAEPLLRALQQRTLFIEQPIPRAAAQSRDIRPLAERIPIIIDESDGTLDAFPQARTLGYSGVSSKSCKGLYKSLINAARCVRANERAGRAVHFLSAEDLTCQSGLAVQQDLALIALLGIEHVERNGHHYVNGMAGAPQPEQQAFLQQHPDLYRAVRGRTCLAIENGRLRLDSLGGSGFATRARPDWAAMQPMQLSTKG
jgi:L-alanine-DL-glutamate epimerase-like enolase superfamily enzyme